MLGFFFFSTTSFAVNGNANLELHADKTEVEKEEQLKITLSLKIMNSDSRVNLEQTNIPGLNNFLPVNSTKSTQLRSMNGLMMTISETQKTVLPHKVGTFQLGPVELVLKDSGNGNTEKILSNKLVINVVDKNVSNVSKYTGFSSSKKAEQNIFHRYIKNGDELSIGKIIAVFLAFFFIGGGVTLSYYLKTPQREKKKLIKQKIKIQQKWDKDNKRPLELPKINSSNFYSQMRALVVDHIYNLKRIEVGYMTTDEILKIIDGLDGQVEISVLLKTCDKFHYAKEDVDRNYLLQLAHDISEKV